MEKITLTTQLVNALVGYLGTRPYQEVFQLIQAIQDAAKAEESKVENGNSGD